MTHRNNLSVNGKWISTIAALLCLCMLLASCRTADSGIDAGDVTPENSMSQQEEPETDKSETADRQTTAVPGTTKSTAKVPHTSEPITEAPNTTVPVTEPETTFEPLPMPEGDFSWIHDTYSDRAMAYLKKYIKSYADQTLVCRYDQLDVNAIDELFNALENLPLRRDFTGEPTFKYVQIGKCMMSVEPHFHYKNTCFTSATAYGHTVELTEPIFSYSTWVSAVINYEDKVVINTSGNIYVITEQGVYSEIHGDYVYENRESSEAYFRAFYVEDGQLRCHRYPAKFYMKYPYRPGLEFDWDQLTKNFDNYFVGYGELWCEWSDVTFDASGAPVYTVTKTEYVDEGLVVHCFLGEAAYQRYLNGTLHHKDLDEAKRKFESACENAISQGYQMVK